MNRGPLVFTSKKHPFLLCPKCKRRGMHYLRHPGDARRKDFSRVECRFCKARFRRRTTNDL